MGFMTTQDQQRKTVLTVRGRTPFHVQNCLPIKFHCCRQENRRPEKDLLLKDHSLSSALPDPTTEACTFSPLSSSVGCRQVSSDDMIKTDLQYERCVVQADQRKEPSNYLAVLLFQSLTLGIEDHNSVLSQFQIELSFFFFDPESTPQRVGKDLYLT